MPYDVKVNKQAFMASLRKQELALVRFAGRTAVGEVRKLMDNSPATGRLYPSRKPGGGTHRASAPGEPPAVDTKKLRNSIAAVTRETQTGAESIVGSNAYGKPIWRYLEFGTRSILPRPSARLAYATTMQKVREQLRQGQRGMVFTGSFGAEVS